MDSARPPPAVPWQAPAAKAGVFPGMFIATVGNTPVDTPTEFRRAVAKLTGPVTLQIIGEFNSPRFITIEPE